MAAGITVTSDAQERSAAGRTYSRANRENLLADLDHIVERLSEFYSDPCTVCAWLHSRHKCFGGLRPTDLIQEGRIQDVLDAIQAMENPVHT